VLQEVSAATLQRRYRRTCRSQDMAIFRTSLRLCVRVPSASAAGGRRRKDHESLGEKDVQNDASPSPTQPDTTLRTVPGRILSAAAFLLSPKPRSAERHHSTSIVGLGIGQRGVGVATEPEIWTTNPDASLSLLRRSTAATHQDHGPPSKHKCALVQPTSQKSQREPGSLITHRLRITR
jgi:hypothetical protein